MSLPVSVSVASWNVLAGSYIRREFYPRTPAAVLDPAWRRAAVVRRVEFLDADVICLQEVEFPVRDALASRLGVLGYGHEFVLKAGGKPDGCMTLWRRSAFALRGSNRLVYSDGGGVEAASGHVALLLKLEHRGRLLGVANTHARWDPPGTPPGAQRGLRQITELVCERIERDVECRSWVVCGDLNAEPGSDLVRFLLGRDFRDPFTDDAWTCNANRRPKRIDYALHTPDLIAVPEPLALVNDETPLPSEEEPSDHVPIVVRIEWSS